MFTIDGAWASVRQLEPRDFDQMYRWHSRVDKPANADDTVHLRSPEAFAQDFNWMLASACCCVFETDQPFGFARLKRSSLQDGWLEITGQAIGNASQLPSLEALALYVRLLFDRFPARSILEHVPAWRTAEADLRDHIGFELQYVAPDHYWAGGRYWDRKLLRMHRDRWMNRMVDLAFEADLAVLADKSLR